MQQQRLHPRNSFSSFTSLSSFSHSKSIVVLIEWHTQVGGCALRKAFPDLQNLPFFVFYKLSSVVWYFPNQIYSPLSSSFSAVTTFSLCSQAPSHITAAKDGKRRIKTEVPPPSRLAIDYRVSKFFNAPCFRISYCGVDFIVYYHLQNCILVYIISLSSFLSSNKHKVDLLYSLLDYTIFF